MTFSEAKVSAESEERNRQATQQLPAVQGESKGRKEATFEERNQTLRQSNRVDLRGGWGAINSPKCTAIVIALTQVINYHYRLVLLIKFLYSRTWNLLLKTQKRLFVFW